MRTAISSPDLPLPPGTEETAPTAPTADLNGPSQAGDELHPPFKKVLRGYDSAAVDRYIADLLDRLHRVEEAATGGSRGELGGSPTGGEHLEGGEADRQREHHAVAVGTVLLDAREAAERIVSEAEVAAAALIADAETEAGRLVDLGRADAERAMAARRTELLRELDDAQEAARQMRLATTRLKERVDEWRQAALGSYEQMAASLQQWPGQVPDPTDLAQVLEPSEVTDEAAGS